MKVFEYPLFSFGQKRNTINPELLCTNSFTRLHNKQNQSCVAIKIYYVEQVFQMVKQRIVKVGLCQPLSFYYLSGFTNSKCARLGSFRMRSISTSIISVTSFLIRMYSFWISSWETLLLGRGLYLDVSAFIASGSLTISQWNAFNLIFWSGLSATIPQNAPEDSPAIFEAGTALSNCVLRLILVSLRLIELLCSLDDFPDRFRYGFCSISCSTGRKWYYRLNWRSHLPARVHRTFLPALYSGLPECGQLISTSNCQKVFDAICEYRNSFVHYDCSLLFAFLRQNSE